MVNPAAFQQTLHMTLAAYAATGFVVAGIHALLLLRDPLNAFHRRALAIGLLVGAPAAVLQPLSGDLSARHVAEHQPVKLAAMEALFETRAAAPLLHRRLAGHATARRRASRSRSPTAFRSSRYHDPKAEVKGLDVVPRSDWPNVPIVHLAFQIMVGCGSVMALVALWVSGRWSARRDLDRRAACCSGAIALLGAARVHRDRGRLDRDRGRAPAVDRLRRAADQRRGDTDARSRWSFLGFTLLYLFLGVVVAWLLYSQIIRSPRRAGLAPDLFAREEMSRGHATVPGGDPRWRHRGRPQRLRRSLPVPTSAAACGTCWPAGRGASGSAS